MKKIRCCLLFFIMAVFCFKLTGKAAGQDEQILLEIQKDTFVYESPAKDSKTLAALEKGTPVICMKTDLEAWYEITYQEIRGYVKAEDLGLYGAAKEIDDEFEAIEDEDEQLYEAVYEKQRQNKSDLFWIGVMAVLIVMIFVTGICTVIKNNKKDMSDKEE